MKKYYLHIRFFKQYCAVAALGAGVLSGMGDSVMGEIAWAEDVKTAKVEGNQAAEDRIINLLVKRMNDERVSVFDRREAVEGLLSIGSPDAITQLVKLLDVKANTNDPLLSVILSGLGQTELDLSEHRNLFLKVSGLLGVVNLDLSDDLGFALGSFEHNGTRQWLMKEVRNGHSSAKRRGDAVLALGYQRYREVGAFLIDELKYYEKGQMKGLVYDRLFESLEQLSGVDHRSKDVAGWRKWWEDYRELDDAIFEKRVNQQIGISRRLRGDKIIELEKKLVDAQAKLFWAVEESQQQLHLIEMLETKDVDLMRLRGLTLVLDLNIKKDQISKGLWEAIYLCLEDPAVSVRSKTVGLLRSLGDKHGAGLIAKRMHNGLETHEEVQRLSLVMLKSYPRLDVIDACLRFLSDGHHINETAELLAEVFQELGKTVPREKLDQAEAILHGLIKGNEPNEIGLVYLLAAFDDARNWKLIEKWLGSRRVGIKAAAAEVWVKHQKSLTVLSKFSGDPVIQRKLIPEVSERGEETAVLLNMIKYRPKDKTIEEAWLKMLVKLSGRVSGEGILEAEKHLSRGADALGSVQRLAMINAGLKKIGEDKVKKFEVLSTQLSVAKMQHEYSLGRYAEVINLGLVIEKNAKLNGDDLRGLWRIMYLSGLRLKDINQAERISDLILKDQPTELNWIIEMAVLSGEGFLKTKDLANAQIILKKISEADQNKLSEINKKRVADLKKSIDTLIKPKPVVKPEIKPKPTVKLPPKSLVKPVVTKSVAKPAVKAKVKEKP